MVHVENPDGLGIIDILSDGFLYCLKIDRIMAADSYDNGGTIAHYYELAGYNRKDIAAIAGRMNKVLTEASAAAVEEQIREFLLLFAPGNYEIETDQTTDSYEFASGNYYPWGELFINLTQHPNELDEARIAFYAELISKGPYPRLVLFNKSWRHYSEKHPDDYNDESIHFLLDGHHKLMAYHRLKKPIHYVLIRGFFPEKLSPGNKGALLLDALPVLSTHFRDFLLLSNTQVLTGTDETARQYNQLLDQSLADSERPGIHLMDKLKVLCETGTDADRRWAMARLDALSAAFQKGCKPKTFYYLPAGNKYWEQLPCKNHAEFNRWCVHYFGMPLSDYRTRILFGR